VLRDKPTVTVLGLACPVGLTPESAAAAFRANIDGFTELPYFDNAGRPIIGAAVSRLPHDMRGRDRLIELLAAAFVGVQERLPRELPFETIPLLLCTRESERPGPRLNGIVAEVEGKLGVRIRRDKSVRVAYGSTAAFRALERARDIVAEGVVEACFIAGVDTLVDSRALRWLDLSSRLKTVTQSDGVIPGEAACVMLVTTSDATRSQLRLRGLGFGHETATVSNEQPFLGGGMTTAVKSALAEAGLAMHEMDLRVSDLTGESYAFEELALAEMRTMRQVPVSLPLWHPADKIGDCGAAAGLVQIAWVEQALLRGYLPGQYYLLHSSATDGDRAAALVAATGPSRP
jgi:3-oxoacyl-[acyl-carrier-protein] synthase-1